MKEILFALVLAALIGWVTACNGNDRFVAAPTASHRHGDEATPGLVVPARTFGFRARHYSIHSTPGASRYDTEYTLLDFPIGIFASVPAAAEHGQFPPLHRPRGRGTPPQDPTRRDAFSAHRYHRYYDRRSVARPGQR
jgi:hypothetical protein